VFDIDETLLDNGHQQNGRGYHEEFRRQAVVEIGKQRKIPALASVTYEQSAIAFRTAHQHTFAASLWNLLCMTGVRKNPLAIDEQDELMIAITDRKNQLYSEALESVIRPIPFASELIKTIHEYCGDKMSIASTACRVDIDKFLEVNQFSRYFAATSIVSLESITRPKPDPEAFSKAFRMLGLPPSAAAQTIAFEDAPNGVASAKQSGLYTVALTTHYSRDELADAEFAPDRIIDSYQEIIR